MHFRPEICFGGERFLIESLRRSNIISTAKTVEKSNIYLLENSRKFSNENLELRFECGCECE